MTRQLRLLLTSSSSPLTPPAQPLRDQLNSDYITILAALLCALICFLGLVAITRCAWLRRISSSSSAPQTSHSKANKGLKKKVIGSLSTQLYSSEFAEADCVICLAEFVNGDQIRVLPQCGHGFHVECIDTWLRSHSSCPSCRRILVVGRCRKCGRGGGGVSSEARRKQMELEDGQTTATVGYTPAAQYLP